MDLPDFKATPAIEYSALGRLVTRSGVTVRVLIYRAPSIDMRWTLEVEDHHGSVTCWEETFATAQEASDVFEQHLRLKGIRSFLESATRH